MHPWRWGDGCAPPPPLPPSPLLVTQVMCLWVEPSSNKFIIWQFPLNRCRVRGRAYQFPPLGRQSGPAPQTRSCPRTQVQGGGFDLSAPSCPPKDIKQSRKLWKQRRWSEATWNSSDLAKYQVHNNIVECISYSYPASFSPVVILGNSVPQHVFVSPHCVSPLSTHVKYGTLINVSSVQFISS